MAKSKVKMDAVFQMGNLGRGSARQFGIDIDFQPTPVILVAQFNKLGLDIRSFHEPLHRSVKNVMVPSIRKNFEQEGRPTRWQPLTLKWMQEKERRGAPYSDILKMYGKLSKVATQQNIWTINGIAGEAFIRDLPQHVWYGKVHQEGFSMTGDGMTRYTVKRPGQKMFTQLTEPKRGKRTKNKGARFGTMDTTEGVPARPFLLIQTSDEKKIEKEFLTWLQERFDAHGWRKGRVEV